MAAAPVTTAAAGTPRAPASATRSAEPARDTGAAATAGGVGGCCSGGGRRSCRMPRRLTRARPRLTMRAAALATEMRLQQHSAGPRCACLRRSWRRPRSSGFFLRKPSGRCRVGGRRAIDGCRSLSQKGRSGKGKGVSRLVSRRGFGAWSRSHKSAAATALAPVPEAAITIDQRFFRVLGVWCRQQYGAAIGRGRPRPAVVVAVVDAAGRCPRSAAFAGVVYTSNKASSAAASSLAVDVLRSAPFHTSVVACQKQVGKPVAVFNLRIPFQLPCRVDHCRTVKARIATTT